MNAWHTHSELQGITFDKNHCNYVYVIITSWKSPKLLRFSLIGHMQGYVLDIVEELYYANDIYVTPASRAGWAQRQAHQRKAMATLKLLAWVAQVSMEQGAPFSPSSMSRSACSAGTRRTCCARGSSAIRSA